MNKDYTIRLSDSDLGQAIDGLEMRAEAWEKTAEYLRNGAPSTGELFLIEECNGPKEAESIAEHYRSYSEDSNPNKGAMSAAKSFCIFIDTVVDGPMPSVRDADGRPFVFLSKLEAQREIADNAMTRWQEFLDGEREFGDAMTVEEYVVEVELQPDGTVLGPHGLPII